MKKRLKNILLYIFITLLGIHIIFSAILPERMIDILGYRTFVVLTPSMDPTIKTGDMIITTSIEQDDLEVGDIITFKVYIRDLRDENYVTHYIAAIEEDDFGNTIYKTQGEGQEPDNYDDWVDADGNPIDITFSDIEGAYLLKIPFVGTLFSFFNNPIFLGLVVINIFVIYITIKYIKQSRNHSETNQ